MWFRHCLLFCFPKVWGVTASHKGILSCNGSLQITSQRQNLQTPTEFPMCLPSNLGKKNIMTYQCLPYVMTPHFSACKKVFVVTLSGVLFVFLRSPQHMLTDWVISANNLDYLNGIFAVFHRSQIFLPKYFSTSFFFFFSKWYYVKF